MLKLHLNDITRNKDVVSGGETLVGGGEYQGDFLPSGKKAFKWGKELDHWRINQIEKKGPVLVRNSNLKTKSVRIYFILIFPKTEALLGFE
jgi:hypothetical protein